MHNIKVLDRSSLPLYLLLVQQGMRQLVRDAKEEDGLLILGATYWGEAAGAAVVRVGKDAAWLLDIYVLPSYRQAGIGAALLAAAEEQVRLEGIPSVQTLFRPDEQTPIFARLLHAQGWTTPVLRSRVFWTRCAVAFGPWVSHYRLRPPYEFFAWPELTEVERTRLRERGEVGWYPRLLSPFHRADDAWDPESSVGLRYNGEVVGWCLTVREKPQQKPQQMLEHLLVETLFVDPPLQRLGKGFMLVGEAIRRYCASGGDHAYWRVSPENGPMLRWSAKAFAGDGLIDQYEEWTSEKILVPAD